MGKSYDKNNNPIYIKEGVKITKEWREQTHKEFYETYGNGWWIFAGLASVKRTHWIDKFRKTGGLE
jgi:hypothetical protein